MVKRLDGLQALRAAAAYAVVLFHVMEFLSAASPLGLPRFVSGAAGVDLFFVISGFVMVYVTPDHETATEFAAKRIARIVPLYWAATLLAIVAAIAVPWSFDRADLSPGSILSSFLFLPAENLPGWIEPILFVGWTLNFEMAFYACFALSLLAPARVRPYLLSGLIVGGMLAAMSFGTGVWAFYGNTMVLEFLAGCIVGWFLQSGTAQRIMPQVPVWPVALAGLAGFVLTSYGVWPDLGRHVVYGLPATLLVFAVAAQDMYRTPFTNPVLRSLGDSSYSAYLLHPFAVTLMGWAVAKYTAVGFAGASLMLIGSFTLTLLAAQLSFRALELPANRWLRDRFGLSRPRSTVTARAD